MSTNTPVVALFIDHNTITGATNTTTMHLPSKDMRRINFICMLGGLDGPGSTRKFVKFCET